MIKRLLAVLFLCASAWATTTVSGNIKNLGTSAVSAGTFVRFYLRGCSGNLPRVAGTAIIAPTLGNVYYFDFVPNASGAISGTLYSTRDSTGLLGGDIECGGSTTAVWYGFVPFVNGKAGPETPIHAKNTATIDISNITPITSNPVVAAPTGDTTYCRLDGGNCDLNTGTHALSTGTGTFSGLLTCKNFEAARCVDSANTAGWAGTDVGGWINAAIQNLPVAPTGGEVLVMCPPSSQYLFSTTILIDRPVRLHFTGVGGQGNVGCLLDYTGSGMGIQVYGVGAFGGATGSVLEGFSMANTGTGTVGIDVDQSAYGVKLRDIEDQPGTAWSAAFIRVGNTTGGGQVVDTTLDHVYCHGETHCLVSLRNYGLNITGGTVFDQSNIQFGDSTHISSAASVFGGVWTSTANGTVITVLNSQALNIYGLDMETDGTGYSVDCPSTATSCGFISYHGGRINTASLGNQNTWIFDNNFGGTSWDIKDVTVLGLGAGTFFFRNQTAPGIAVLSGLNSTSGTVTDATAYTNVFSYGHNLNGTINTTQFFKNTLQLDGIGAGVPGKILLNDNLPRTTMLKSPDSVVNGQVGTTTAQSFEGIANGNIGWRLTPVAAPVFQIAATLQNLGATATMGLTQKKGSGSGNYTSASTTYVVVDSTNLCFTVTIPTGWKLGVQAQGSVGTLTAIVAAQVALTDNAACSTANAGILQESATSSGAIGATAGFALGVVIAGDGASHNIAMQFKTANASDSITLSNSSATLTPTMVFTLMPSN